MDKHTKQLGCVLLEPDFESSLDIMHARQRQIVWQSAMTGNVQASPHPLDLNLMHIEHFGKLRRDHLEAPLQRRVADDFVPFFYGCRLALDMSQDRGDFRDLLL